MKKKQFFFKSEIKQLLKLMINSLYSNKEIFLRELISNSSDAIDKLRFYLVNKNNDMNIDSNFHIRLFIDNNKLIVRDNGIGMTYEEIISSLGTIAKSGTKEFIKNLSLNKNNKNNNFIGKFGVGFYSSFIVANKVKVHTRSILENNNKKAILWSSKGDGKFTINNLCKDSIGTDVILYIKDECKQFLNESKLYEVVNKYSSYIDVPIEYKKFDEKNKLYIWKKINNFSAIWLKNKNDITDKEYKSFYSYLTNNLGSPLIWSHNKVEGINSYISLLYIPDTSPWNILNRDDYKNNIKLYIKKVFIMDNINNIIPTYFRFIQGLIDVDNLSLNISREILQENECLKKISISLTNRIFKMLNDLTVDTIKYKIFWKNFGNILKEGLVDSNIDKFNIINLLRFYSSKSDDEILVSLQNYIDNMKVGQDKIFYLTSDNYFTAKNSPHLEIYNKNNIEVLFLIDKIDEWMMSYLTDFKGIQFVAINKNNINNFNNVLINENKVIHIDKKEYNFFFNRIKDVLKDLIKDVRITNNLDKFPVVLITDSNDMSTQMLKLLQSVGKDVPKIKYFFDINVNHILIKYIEKIEDNNSFKKWIYFLYYQALLIESNSLENPVDFINLINELLCNFIFK